MEIILSILQILGIILLVIFGLILLILVTVLFVPIRYQILGNVQDSTDLEGKATWLLHLLKAQATYEDELLYVELRILWKKISFTKEFSEDKGSLNKDNVNTNTKEPSKEFFEKEEPIKKEDSFEKVDSESIEGTPLKSNIFDKCKNRINIIKEKIIFIKEKWVQIKKIIQDKKNQQAIRHLKDELIYLIKILLPRKSMLNGIFSTGSPDTTGQIYGVICCFPIIYQDDWSLIPDFEAEKAYFKGEFQGKGRIYIYRLVGILSRIILDKNCRRLYYFINRLGGQNNGGRK